MVKCLSSRQGEEFISENVVARRFLGLEEKLLPHIRDHSNIARALEALSEEGFREVNHLIIKEALRLGFAKPQILSSDTTVQEPAIGDVGQSLNNLAGIYSDQGKYAEAEPLLLRSLEIREKILGPNHPDVANGLNNLAGLYHDQGKYAEAEPLYQRALEIIEKTLGPEHPYFIVSLKNYAHLLKATGREAEAEEMMARAEALRAERDQAESKD